MAIQINGNGTITGISAGGLPAGSVTSATLANSVTTGKILQVLSGSTSTESVTQSTSYSDNGLSLAITPSATSSKILVMINISVQSHANAYNAGGSIKVLRDSTEIYTPMFPEMYGYFSASSSNANMFDRYPIMVVDSPNTTSSITYKTQHRALNTSTYFKSQTEESGNQGTSYITLMEIAA